jgi:murein DD-endopeptidase MepM/ murein hydrolase activator NlpD
MLGFRVRKMRGKASHRRPPSTQGPLLEIQVHPSQIRLGVRYFFFSPRQLVAWAAGILLYVALVVFSLIVSPIVIGNIFQRSEYESLVAERRRQGERLQTLSAQLTEVGEASESLHLRMSRIYLAYGLDNEHEEGHGSGYPFPEVDVPQSIFRNAIRHGRGLERRISERMAVLGSFIEEVQGFEAEHADQVRTTPSLAPLEREDFVLTSPFGTRRSPFTKQVDFHPGIDLAAATGTPIFAPADGKVVFAGRYPVRQSVSWWRYGNLVAVRHGDRFISIFGHCDTLAVRVGQAVKQGEVLAAVGNTGWSTSPHLHYEVRRREEEGDYKPVDPRVYILDHSWRDEEQLLVRGRRAPDLSDFEPLPSIIARRR